MMKLLKSILLLFYFFQFSLAYAGRANVVVLTTPLFLSPNKSSTILQYVRKGDILYIHDSILRNGPNDIDYENDDEITHYYSSLSNLNNQEFLKTQTRTGETAYVLADHVKIIYADAREFQEGNKVRDHDVTDYRIHDPLPPEYPFWDQGKFHSVVAYSFGPQRKENYPYNSKIVYEDFNSRKGFNLMLMKKVAFDPYDRFYYGLNLQGFTSKSSFVLYNGASYLEDGKVFSAGPYFAYDAFRLPHLTIAFAGGVTGNLHMLTIKASINGNEEERTFTGITVTPRLGSHLSFTNYVRDLDFVLGAELQAQFPFTLKSSDGVTNSNLWNSENDNYSYELGASFSIYLGVQTKI